MDPSTDVVLELAQLGIEEVARHEMPSSQPLTEASADVVLGALVTRVVKSS
jgi:hypothetical protein